LGHENKRILQGLSMRLTARCAEQENRIRELRAARVMEKNIEQLDEEMKHKDATIARLKQELMNTKKEAAKTLEKEKGVEVLKCEEINILGGEMAKLRADLVSTDKKIKETQLDREEKLQPIHSHAQLLISSVGLSVNKSEEGHSNKVATFNLEIDQLKKSSKREAIAFQQNDAKLEQLEKIIGEKDENIEQQKRYYTKMEKELAETSLLVDETARQKVESEDNIVHTYDLLVDIQEGIQKNRRYSSYSMPSLSKRATSFFDGESNASFTRIQNISLKATT